MSLTTLSALLIVLSYSANGRFYYCITFDERKCALHFFHLVQVRYQRADNCVRMRMLGLSDNWLENRYDNIILFQHHVIKIFLAVSMQVNIR